MMESQETPKPTEKTSQPPVGGTSGGSPDSGCIQGQEVDLPKRSQRQRPRWLDNLSPPHQKICGRLIDLENHLRNLHSQSPSNDLHWHIEAIQQALNLIELLQSDKNAYGNQLKDLNAEYQKLVQRDRQWESAYSAKEQELRRSLEERKKLLGERQTFDATYRQQLQKLQDQCDGMAREVEKFKRDLEETERSRDKLLLEIERLKRDAGVHYDGASGRPQHHILTGEYKTLKEQYLDPLVNRLFGFIATSNPDLKRQRKEEINKIKAIIAVAVLLEGQAIVRGESTGSSLPEEILKDVQTSFFQCLQVNFQALSSEIAENIIGLLRRATNLAQGQIEYPTPGKWQERDFDRASLDLQDLLYQRLNLVAAPPLELQAEMRAAIKCTLQFLERAALAEPPACLSLDNEGVPFRSDYHEAAKGWDDEGIVVKTIYPVYLVNGEAKVKAIVLTESSSDTSPATSPDIATSLLLPSESNSSTSEVMPATPRESEEETRRIKLDSLLTQVKNRKWSDLGWCRPGLLDSIIDKLQKVDRLDLIEKLEVGAAQSNSLHQFEAEVNTLIDVKH